MYCKINVHKIITTIMFPPPPSPFPRFCYLAHRHNLLHPQTIFAMAQSCFIQTPIHWNTPTVFTDFHTLEHTCCIHRLPHTSLTRIHLLYHQTPTHWNTPALYPQTPTH